MMYLFFQLFAILIAAMLLGPTKYFGLGIISAILVVALEYSIWKKSLLIKIKTMNLDTINEESAVSISLIVTVITNVIIIFLAWPAVALSRLYAGFVVDKFG